MIFDYKKEYKEFYQPKEIPSIVVVPKMNFLAVRGKGNPNEADGEYQKAIQKLYAVAYALKMSYKGEHQAENYFPYVVPPLEGFWWQENGQIDYAHKENFSWISLIRLPDFFGTDDLEWAKEEVMRKKKLDCYNVEFFTYEEGLSVQCMHIGEYDGEPETVAKMEQFALEQGYQVDINSERYHHEIYLSDPRKGDPSKWRTVLRHPLRPLS